MSEDDDIARRILDGDSYEQAEATVKRTFPISVGRKIQTAIVGLLISALLGPFLLLQREAIVALEGGDPVAFRLGTFSLLGIVTVFVAGLVLIGLESRARSLSATPDRARRLVRIEEMIMWYQLLGLGFVVIATAIAVVGLVSTDTVRLLYEFGVPVYGPAGTVPVDVRVISGLGGMLAILLALLRWVLKAKATDR